MDRRIFLSLLLSLLLLTGLASSGGAAADGSDLEPVPLPVWQDEILLPGTQFYTLVAPSLALDTDGKPHIVYGNNHLFHTWFDGLNWQKETISRSSGWNRESALVINEAGTIFIAEFNSRDLFLHILEPGGSWQALRAPFLRAGYLSIVLDRDGSPHIITGPANNEFVHAHYGPEGWSVERIVADSPAYVQFSAVLDSKDEPLILYEKFDLYHDRHEVLLARRKEESWQNDLLGEGCLNRGGSLVLDGQENAHVIFSEGCDNGLTYAREEDPGWERFLLTSSGSYPSLVLDERGWPNVVYGSMGGQVYAILEDGSWETKLVQAGKNAGAYNSLLLDDAGAAHISSLGPDLQYATNKNGPWQAGLVDVEETFGVRNALVLDRADRMHILYHKLEAEELYWVSGGENLGKPELLASVPYNGLEIALDLDSQDRPHAAFINKEQNQLVAGWRPGSIWNLQQIAGSGRQLSLAVDSADRPHIAVIQDGTLNYWTKEGDVWRSEPVAAVNTWLGAAWLALDSQDRPHIAYSDSNGAFLASRQSAHTWIREALPFENVVRLVFGADDRPYFLYAEERWEYFGRYEVLWVSLWFAEPDGQEWSVKWLWEDEYWNRMSDIEVTANSQVHIALEGTFGDIVYYQRDEGGAWLVEYPPAWGVGDISMAVAQDGQPRLLWHDDASLFLATREIVWLEKFRFLPVVVP